MLNDSFWIMPATPDFINEGIPYITSKNIKKGQILMESAKYISEEDYNRIAKNRPIETNDILISMIGTLGEAAIVKSEYGDFYGQNVYLLRLNDKKISHKYFLYLMKSSTAKRHFESKMNQSTQKYLKADHIESLEIPDISLNEQNEEAEILDKLNSIIIYREEQLNELDNLIKSRFVEMFGDPVYNPFGWKTKPFLECGSCKNGMNFGAGEVGVELQYLGVGDFKSLTKIEDVTKLGQVCLNKVPSEEYMLRNGDIVFVRSNGNKALVGRCLAVYPNGIPTTYSGFCVRYRKTDESLEIPYLLQVLKTESMRLMMAGRGANIQNLNQQILGQLQIPMPPNDLQREFGQFIEQVDNLRVEVQKSLNETQLLFDSLMQKYYE